MVGRYSTTESHPQARLINSFICIPKYSSGGRGMGMSWMSQMPKCTHLELLPSRFLSWHLIFCFNKMGWVYFFLIEACGSTFKEDPKMYGVREVKIIINIF